MHDVSGYRLATPGGDTVGKVVRAVDGGYLVGVGGALRRSYRVVPHEQAWPQPDKRALLLVVPLQLLLDSPPADRQGAVDAAALAHFWSAAESASASSAT